MWSDGGGDAVMVVEKRQQRRVAVSPVPLGAGGRDGPICPRRNGATTSAGIEAARSGLCKAARYTVYRAL